MKTRLAVAVLVYMVVQAVLFGIGTVLVLATPLKEQAMALMPWVVGTSAVVAAPAAWMIAPRLMARYYRRRELEAARIRARHV